MPRCRPGGHARPAHAQSRGRAGLARRDRVGAGRGRLQALAGASAARRAGPLARRDLAQASRAQRTPGGNWLGCGPRGGRQLRVRANARRARRHPGDQGCGAGAEPDPAARRRRGGGARRLDLAPRLARARTRHSHGAGRARRHQPDSGRRAGGGGRRRRHRAVDALMRPRIFITQPIAASALKRLRTVASVTVNPDAGRIIDKRALVNAVRKCDILFSRLHDKIDRDVLAANPRLRAVNSMTITPDNIDVAAATALGIPVTVIPPMVGEATADIAFGLMLAAARRMMEGDRLVRKGGFPGGQSNYLAGSFVHGKTLGLIGGAGRIGKAVARRARGFSMRVLYWGPRRKPDAAARDAAITS